MANISLKTGVVRKPTYDIDKLLATDDDTETVSPDTPTETVSPDTPTETVSPDTPTETVSPDTNSRRQYLKSYRKTKYKRVRLDFKIDEAEYFKSKAECFGITLTEFFRRAGRAYLEDGFAMSIKAKNDGVQMCFELDEELMNELRQRGEPSEVVQAAIDFSLSCDVSKEGWYKK